MLLAHAKAITYLDSQVRELFALINTSTHSHTHTQSLFHPHLSVA